MTHRQTHATREACTGHHLKLMGAVVHIFDQAKHILEIGPGRARFALDRLRGKRVRFFETNEGAASAIVACGEPEWHVVDEDARSAPFGGPYDVIYASHWIEHLTGEELHTFLRRADQSLAPGGHLVIAAPYLWGHFYADMTHVQPYTPHVVIRNLTGGFGDMTWPPVASGYTVVAQVAGYEEGAGRDRLQPYVTWETPFYAARSRWVDWLLCLGRRAMLWAGIRRVRRNSWLLVMRKGTG